MDKGFKRMKKNVEKVEKEEEEEVEEHWSFVRVVIAVMFLLLVGGTIFYFIQPFLARKNTNVLGVQKKEAQRQQREQQALSKEEVNKMIADAQQNLSRMTSENVASYSAELQKVIENLKRLQKEKAPVDIVCDLLCGGGGTH